MNLLVVSQFYAPEPIGTPLYVTGLARWFADRGDRVTVLTGRPYYPEFRLTPGYEGGQRDRENVDGVAVRRLPTLVPQQGRAALRILSEASFLLRAAARLLTGRVTRASRVISFSPSVLTVLAGALATVRGGTHVAVVHDIQSGLAAGLGMIRTGTILKFMRAVETFALNRADYVVVLSENMRRALLEQGVRRPIEVIPLWVDTDAIFPLPRTENGPATVLYSGNLGRKQGLDQVLDMAEVLASIRPDAIVVIRGGGSRVAEIETEARQRGLGHIRFEPLVAIEHLNEGLADGDVHLVPQDPEAADFAVPSKVYNIMAAGRPFVATARAGSTLAALAEETGACACTEPNDPDALAGAIATLLDDASARACMGERGRRYVEQTVSREVVLARYARLVERTGE